tara:strand:+ start:1177 stop:1938 length:762 start_codon:yes stop_codon:yes gene_type:complete
VKKITFLFFIITISSFSQKTKPIYGTVVDSLGVVNDANIYNKNSKIGTNSTQKGDFKIYCKLGDTLVFSSVQHQTKEYIVNQGSFVSFNFKIYLALKTYELDEFELKKHNLSGVLALDVSQVKENENEISAVSLGLPNAGIPKLKPIDRKIYTASTSNGMIPLDLILNTLNGTIKRLKNQKKIIEDNEDVAELYSEYKFNLGADFKIAKEDEYRFLYYCRSDSSFIAERSKTKFEFINFLKLKAKEFNQLKND